MKKIRHTKRRFSTLKATVDKNRKGFAFLIFENKAREDAFVAWKDARFLFHGDRVEVSLNQNGRVTDIRILGHRFREIVGRFTPHQADRRLRARMRRPKTDGWVVYERKNAREEIYVPSIKERIQAGDWVKAKLHFHSEKDALFPVTGEITEIYGKELPPHADLPMVASEFNLEEGHSKIAQKEAGQFRLDLEDDKRKSKDWVGREDLRNLPFFTIDGETARDFDDAIHVETSPDGYILWVAIADVSHYVQSGSHLDREAHAKGTSVYFPEKAFHMLPRALSENLCSLRPNEPRLVLVSKIHFNFQGVRVQTEIMEGVIQSERRSTYNEIEKERRENGNNPNWQYSAHFALYRLLKSQRKLRGSLDFELPEAEVKVDKSGDVLSILTRPRLDSHRLIEEFMIAANEAVTDWMMKGQRAFIFRVHGEPSGLSLERFRRLAANAGIPVKFKENQENSLIVADLMSRLEGHPAQVLLSMALLRSMKQAIYSATHGIHFGLASPGYTHFTSPIRRYPDLVVHRLIKSALSEIRSKKRAKKDKKNNPVSKNTKGGLRDDEALQSICEHCSYRERLATDAEREAIKIKQVRMMLKRLGEEFPGRIVGMISSGLFVQINEPYAEGLVSIESMPDDFYEFDEDRMIIRGRRKKRTFRLGDELKIRVVRADLDRRQIDFMMV